MHLGLKGVGIYDRTMTVVEAPKIKRTTISMMKVVNYEGSGGSSSSSKDKRGARTLQGHSLRSSRAPYSDCIMALSLGFQVYKRHLLRSLRVGKYDLFWAIWRLKVLKFLF